LEVAARLMNIHSNLLFFLIQVVLSLPQSPDLLKKVLNLEVSDTTGDAQ